MDVFLTEFHYIIQTRGFEWFGGKTSYRLANRGPAVAYIFVKLVQIIQNESLVTHKR